MRSPASDRGPRGADLAGRRAVLKSLAAGVATLCAPPLARVAAAADGVERARVAPDLTMLAGAGGNILVLSTDAGKAVVDTGSAAAGRAVLAALDEIPGGAVTTVLNTHWHLDQVGSNEALGRAGAAIIAHEKTRFRLSTGYYVPAEDRYEKPLPAAARPTQPFYTNGSTTVGGRQIDYGYLVAAHTDGDIYAAFPHANVIAVGDVLSAGHDPVFDWFGGGWLGGRVDALAMLLAISDRSTRFVPSRGPVVGRAEVEAEHAVMLDLFERMVVHLRLGESADAMLAAGVLDGLGRTFADPSKLLYDVYKGLWAHHNKLMPDIV